MWRMKRSGNGPTGPVKERNLNGSGTQTERSLMRKSIDNMKNLFIYISLLAFITITSCSSREERVEETWLDGTTKKASVFAGKGADGHKIEEIGYYEDGTKQIQGGLDDYSSRDGVWRYWYKNGQLWSECEYRAGLKNGKSTVYYDNGQKRYEGQYTEDKQVGFWRFWDVNGTLITETNYDKDSIH